MKPEDGERKRPSGISTLDPQLGWVPVIPLPFSIQKWSWRKFRFIWHPHCWECKLNFATKKEWETHYVLNHLEAEP